jgi:hypothetical protein
LFNEERNVNELIVPKPENDLIVLRLDTARMALVEARDAGDAKKVADVARAAEVYAKRQKLSEETIAYATAIKIDAMTLMGEFLQTAPKASGGEHGGRSRIDGSRKEPSIPTPTLASLGIDKKESADAQALAALKHDAPDLHEQVRSGKVSVLQARSEKKRREHKAKIKEQIAAVPQADSAALWRVDHADCLEWFAAQPADSLDLVFGSPPYEQARLCLDNGIDRGIARKTDEWVEWMVKVYEAALRCCTGVVAFVVQGPTKDYAWSVGPALLMAALHKKGITLRLPPIYHRVGIPGSGGSDWLRNDYELAICATRGGKLPWSNNVAMGKPPIYKPGGDPSHRRKDGSRVNAGKASMKERNNVGPHRARRQAGQEYQAPDIANPGNIIAGGQDEVKLHATRGHKDGDAANGRGYVPPALANPGNLIHCKVGGKNMGNELCHQNEAPFPESLAEFFIRTWCRPGAVVCDPFSGSGTTGAVAVRHGRRFLGCDVRQSQVDLSRLRISGETQNVETADMPRAG